MSKAIDETGNRYEKLVVLRRDENNGAGRAQWICLCDCGNKVVIIGKNLRSGSTRSCGCLVTIHGMTDTPEWNTWRNMHKRCTQPAYDSFPYYGGRGIQVCETWQDFRQFYQDMGPRPGSNYSIDRIDSTKDYCPANCRWATVVLQNRNRPGYNLMVSFKGETHCVGEWAQKVGLKYSTLYRRLVDYGWSVEKALTQHVRGQPK